MIKRLMTIAPATLMLAACGETVAEPRAADVDPAFAEVQNEWIPIDFTFFNSCFGEEMTFVGQVKFLSTLTDDGNGGFHATFHRTWAGTATGLTSGDVYSLNFVRNWSEEMRPPFPYNFTQTWRNFITRQGDAGRWALLLKEHYTVNGNGTVTVDRSDPTADCE